MAERLHAIGACFTLNGSIVDGQDDSGCRDLLRGPEDRILERGLRTSGLRGDRRDKRLFFMLLGPTPLFFVGAQVLQDGCRSELMNRLLRRTQSSLTLGSKPLNGRTRVAMATPVGSERR